MKEKRSKSQGGLLGYSALASWSGGSTSLLSTEEGLITLKQVMKAPV